MPCENSAFHCSRSFGNIGGEVLIFKFARANSFEHRIAEKIWVLASVETEAHFVADRSAVLWVTREGSLF
jgi:hypothetical protein